MEKEIAVKCDKIYKTYPFYQGNWDRLKGMLLPGHKTEEFTALEDISIEIPQGQILGMIGLNGSGKSTLASIITGITYPTSGSINVKGEVSMLAANSGMDNYLTGIENIRYKCILMGLATNQIEEIMPDIIEFADIGRYIEQPLRTYSSGMRSRLGFAISVHMEPDILIIDEALSVGDNSFADKCFLKMNEFKDNGKTIIFVSHAVPQMQEFCDKILWLHRGKILGVEEPDKIIMPYCGFAREFNAMTIEERNEHIPTLEEYQNKYL